ncbi:MAG: glycosyltransferase family 1 protein [Elainellaceae cyanobacterium]
MSYIPNNQQTISNPPSKQLVDSSKLVEQQFRSKLYWQDAQNLNSEAPPSNAHDLICLSHLRWDFVYQRPQHLLSRCAKGRRVFVMEEPMFTAEQDAWLSISRRECGVWVVVPHLPEGLDEEAAIATQRKLLDELIEGCDIQNYILWYYTAMAMPFSKHLTPELVVYDCMDELSAFKGAPPILREREAELFQWSDLVFTGGQSLYEAKQHQHPHVHAFPSSIEVEHFGQARQMAIDPADQRDIPHPRLGFYGVIDERMDLELLGGVAEARPDWQLVIIGPVAKIDPENLPRHANIHYLGSKSYTELPDYLSGWDVALLPFARNESTRFISPTKTPEYLAAGKPVVSTSIRDVVRPYGEQRLVHIADSIEKFVKAAEVAMQQPQSDPTWLQQVDAFLSQNSWNLTWERMNHLIETAIEQKQATATESVKSASTN